MIPSAFVALDALPLTPHGKIDRRALPAPERSAPERRSGSVVPRDALELQLARIWEELLGAGPVGVTDNFFALGGHSLLAVGLMAHIERRFGRSLPLAALFQQPTVEQLAALLRHAPGARPATPLVPMQPGGTRLPFYCVHPAGGNVLCYLKLAERLGPAQPFYGLQARGLEDDHPPYTRIEDMAACYVDAIRAVQPQGPYQIGGWSTGGIVAFEMAQLLRRQGQQVGLLALIDTGAPSAPGSFSPQLPTDGEIIAGMIGQEQMPMPYADFQQLDPAEQVRYALELAKQARVLPLDAGLPQIQRLLDVFKANARATLEYLPQVYPGRIALFRTASSEAGAAPQPASEPAALDLTLGWGALSLQPVMSYLVPGTHSQIVSEPYVGVLAELLRDCLDACQAQEPPAGIV